ncbi:hypothetical protein AKJ16_DCAP14678 [Drosera capensis]
MAYEFFWRRRNWWSKVGRLLALPNVAAISAANRHVSKFPSLMMVMTEAYIGYRVLDLPKSFVKKYIGGNTRDIHLQVYKRVWPVKMRIYGDYKNRLGAGCLTQHGARLQVSRMPVGAFEYLPCQINFSVAVFHCVVAELAVE